MERKLQLYGFNNLTKSLSFNIYDVCYAKTPKQQQEFIKYINHAYNSARLTAILYEVTEMIGAHVLNVSKQDYEPQGASVTFLIAEEEIKSGEGKMHLSTGGETIVGHLDKSHITVHTYPEFHPENAIVTFRADIDVATCGEITPLKTLNFLISSFESDVITMDYRVRGFTRDVHGKKCFLDQEVNSIRDYICWDILNQYDAVDVNIKRHNIFHTKLMIKEIDLQNYLFHVDASQLCKETKMAITEALQLEMQEIFHGQNL